MGQLFLKMRLVLKEEEGQGMVEYGLIIALIALGVIGALTLLGPQIAAMFTGARTAMGG